MGEHDSTKGVVIPREALVKGLHKAVNVCQERIRRVAAILVGIFQVGYGFLQGVIVLVAQRIGNRGRCWRFCNRLNVPVPAVWMVLAVLPGEIRLLT